MPEEYYIGQIFINTYPADAVFWADENDCGIVQIENDEQGNKRFQIQKNTQPTAAVRKEIFLKSFFKVGDIGYYRRIPKGYTSAIESINTAYNMAKQEGGLPVDTLIFYPEPDFKMAEQCTEEWLVAHQIKLPAMDFNTFYPIYKLLVITWNKENH